MSLSPAGRVRRGRLRGTVAAVMVACWLVAMGGLVQRDVRRSAAQRMAELALRVNPGSFFYAVERDGRHIGFASSVIDTFPDTSATYLLVRDAVVFDVRLGDSVSRTTLRSDVTLSRGFRLLTFSEDSDAGVGRAGIAGWAEDDSTLRYALESAGHPADTQRVGVGRLALVPSLVPLATVLGARPRVGRRTTYRAFDPASRTAHDVTTEILAESLFVVNDSARVDSFSGRWVPALRDTVRAWHLVSTGGAAFNGWLDAQGRVVEAVHPAGVTLRRMAYELAFENWRASDGASAR